MNTVAEPVQDSQSLAKPQSSYWIVVAVALLVAAGHLYYSQTWAYARDEGFHMVTALLIKQGKHLYSDFNFSQTPLNAYWNAFWISVFGVSWRVIHAVAAVMVSIAVFLTGDFVYRRFPVLRWRLAAAVTAMLAVALNVMVVQFGSVGQAYGLCLFSIVVAFRFAVRAVEVKGVLPAIFAGLFSALAAGASLLTAPVCPVLAIWMAFQNQIGNRWAKLVAFIAAAVVPFIPLLRLFLRSPKHVLFNVIEYNLVYRQVEWPNAIPHDIGVVSAWLESTQALLLGLLAIAGLLFVHFRSNWTKGERQIFFLCGWLSVALAAHISSAHPTFQRYYLFTTPFLAILAMAGLYSLAERLYDAGKPLVPAFAFTLLVALALGRILFQAHDDYTWQDTEKVAAKVDQVTPRDGVILADEQIYFITGRPIPMGQELTDAHKLDFPPERSAFLHLVPTKQLVQQIKAGKFATVQYCGELDDGWEDADLPKLYGNKAEIEDCTVYWGLHARP